MTQAIYVYGVIGLNEEKRFVPIEKACSTEVYTIPYKDIASVVSDYPKNSFDYRTREIVANELIKHQTVIENIMKQHTIIPIKFGTIFENTDGVRKVLEKGYSEFKDKLKKIEKKIELDVVAVWNNLDSIIKRIGQENEEINKFKEEIAKKSAQDTFQERIEIGSMIKDALEKEKSDLQTKMLEFLKEKVKVCEFKKHELMDARMILNCAFLLDKDKESEFDRALKELNKKYNEKINFRCISSLPLYSFFTYEVKKVNFENIDNARKLLGLGEEVDTSEIKASYRRLAREKHPDKFLDDIDAQKKFEEIQRAYKTLLDYCQNERKCIRKEDVESSYMISIFDVGHVQ
jgi:DnaJ-domain-containing protein 1